MYCTSHLVNLFALRYSPGEFHGISAQSVEHSLPKVHVVGLVVKEWQWQQRWMMGHAHGMVYHGNCHLARGEEYQLCLEPVRQVVSSLVGREE